MRVTTKGQYAIRALIDISTTEKPMTAREIADRQKLPMAFLLQIMKNLKDKGIVNAIKGPGGGYVLAQHEDSVTLESVLNAAGERLHLGKTAKASSPEVEGTTGFKVTKGFLNELDNVVNGVLSHTTLGEVRRKYLGDGAA